METIEINYKYKPGTRLYRVTYGELKYYDVECVNINLSLNRDEPLITYQLRVNNSSEIQLGILKLINIIH